MAVPNIFANVPGGTTIPLAELDENFAYITGSPVFTNLSVSGNLTVGGQSTFTGGVAINGTLSVDGVSINPTGLTGSGNLVLSNNPTLVSPNLGTPASGILTNCTGLPVLTGISGLGAGIANFLSSPSSSNLAAAVLDETGTGSLVFNTNPSFITPNLGTPSAGVLTNCNGYPSANLVGPVPLSLGGTGGNDRITGLNNLLPTQTAGVAGYVLTTNGTGGVTWEYNATAGTVSSVALDPSTTGLTVNGGTAPVTITTTGTFALGGILAVSNGGTGTSSPVNTAGGIITYASYAPAAGKTLTLGNTMTLNGVDASVYTLPPATCNIGYLELPPNAQGNGYTTALTDSGKFIDFTSGGATVTIAANASVNYPIGTVITFTNLTGSNVSIACGDTMYFGGTGLTGTRTLNNSGLATALKVNATNWIISGSGLS
jgi:hypothetical protein